MAKAGHTDMKITRRYLHMAGIVFHDEAHALERRLLGGGPKSSTEPSTRLSEPDPTSDDPNGSNKPFADAADLAS
jgi:hypothetical protein